MVSLKHALLIGLSMASFATAAQSKIMASAAPADKALTQSAAPTFDYAFGDHIAGAMKRPGATGKNWDLGDALDGLKDFCEKNPGALKGKNVLVVICYSKSVMNVFNGTAFKNRLMKEVGNGHIVIMGSSELRAGKASKMTNDQIKNLAAQNPNVIIYGGPVLDPPPPGSNIDVNKVDKIYPTTPEEIKKVETKSAAALKSALEPQPKKQTGAKNARK